MKITGFFALLVITSVLIAGCSAAPGSIQDQTTVPTLAPVDSSTPAQEEIVVEIDNFAFVPAEVTIAVGTTVKWTNKDGVSHTVTSDDGVFDSGLLKKGDSFTYTFTQAGVFPYHCTPHSNMQASIIVK